MLLSRQLKVCLCKVAYSLWAGKGKNNKGELATLSWRTVLVRRHLELWMNDWSRYGRGQV